jgi:hypothetical protein
VPQEVRAAQVAIKCEKIIELTWEVA